MLNRALLSELIADIYEASYQPDLWPKVTEKITRITDSRSGALFIQDKNLEAANGFYATGFSDNEMETYSRLGHLDPAYPIMKNVPVGEAINIYGAERHELEPPIYYEEVRKRYDIGYVCGASIIVDEEQHVGLGLQRSASEGEYNSEVLALISEIIPHLQRGLRIHREFIRLRVEKTALAAGLDNQMMGLVLFDQFGTPLYINSIAESIFTEHPAIDFINNRIVPQQPEDAVQLHRMVISCLNPDRNTDTQPGGVMGLHHSERRHPLALMVTPVATSDLANIIDGVPVYAAMYINDPERPISIDARTLASLYQLSSTEAKIAIALANGASVEEIAASQNRSTHTVRSHLKSLFQKTGTGNQTELVKLLLTGGASLPHNGK